VCVCVCVYERCVTSHFLLNSLLAWSDATFVNVFSTCSKCLDTSASLGMNCALIETKCIFLNKLYNVVNVFSSCSKCLDTSASLGMNCALTENSVSYRCTEPCMHYCDFSQ
jgi:hypothetical protein